MTANELRIGNYVFLKETQSFQKIVGITEENPFVDTITFDYLNWEDIEPIELTEEILLKCGFEIAYKSDFTKTFNNAQDDRFSAKINISSGLSIWYLGIPIKVMYLHQLQNLYFSLTDKELKINL